jgi:predicted  nucleic acid-binding Zn-ribbon protein
MGIEIQYTLAHPAPVAKFPVDARAVLVAFLNCGWSRFVVAPLQNDADGQRVRDALLALDCPRLEAFAATCTAGCPLSGHPTETIRITNSIAFNLRR